MQAILKSINAVAGVTGSLVSDAQGELLASVFPAAFDPEALAIVARAAAQTAAGVQRVKRTKVLKMYATYGAGRFIVQNLRTGYLCILSGPQINIPLLNLTIAGATSRLPEMIEQGVTEPVRPAAAAEPLDALSHFVEKLIQEFGERGIGREQLLSIVGRRLERLQSARPVLGAINTSGGMVDLTALRSRSNSDISTAVSILVAAICQTSVGMLGRDATHAKYRQVWDIFRHQNEDLVRRLSLDSTLDRADSLEGGPLPGLDMRL